MRASSELAFEDHGIPRPETGSAVKLQSHETFAIPHLAVGIQGFDIEFGDTVFHNYIAGNAGGEHAVAVGRQS